MADANGGDRRPLDQTRQVTIDALCEHFANDVMSVEEFERRIDLAHQATEVEGLKELLRDLPGGNLPALADRVEGKLAAEGVSVTSAANVKEREVVVAVLGGGGRSGRWRPARKNFAVTVMGGAELDFREAIMGPGVTELHVFAMCGGVEIVVPPGLNVESHGMALLGGFEHVADQTLEPDPLAPTLRITGLAVMGGVEVSVRHRGESARDARRRRRQERREQRRLMRGR